MTVQTPLYLQKKLISARRDRGLISDVFGAIEQVLGQNQLLCSLTTGLGTSIAAGNALVKGDDVANQGLYHCFNDAAVTLTHTADPTNPRVNLIVLSVDDSAEVGSGPDQGLLEIIPGTPSGAASLTNLASWPAIPNTAMPISAVRVGAAAASLASTDLLDLRPRTRGKSIIATTESRTNVAYGLMSTPDVIRNLVVPTDGVIEMRFNGTWQASVAPNAARAAIFLGANQVVPAYGAGWEAVFSGGVVASDRLLISTPNGLAFADGGAYGGDLTTGQIIGSGVNGAGTTVVGFGGKLEIFAAAGTYDLSVQFKSSSGSVTAKNRKLWAEVKPFPS